jgi:flagellar biosynthetic protein FliR
LQINFEAAHLAQVFLAALRIGVLFMLSPIFASLGGLVAVRMLLSLGLSIVLAASLTQPAPSLVLALGPLLLAAAGEVATGALLAFGVFAAFGAFSVAGKLLDIQAGLSIGSVYDPVTNAGAPVFATLLNMTGVVMFFSLDAHQALLRGIAFSLQQVPPGSGFRLIDIDAVVRQFGLMFSLGVTIASPVVFCLFLSDIGLSLISRTLPQMNAIMIGVPVKILIALAVLAFTAPLLGPVMGRVYATIFLFWTTVTAHG